MDDRFERRSIWRAFLDRVFGYDFFISYCWADGQRYATALAKSLEERGYELFLDRKDYDPGDDWVRIGSWSLARTSQLILVGTAGALDSPPVLREVQRFSATKRRIIPIAFGDSLSIESLKSSGLAPFLPEEALRVLEPATSITAGPTEDAITRIVGSFTHMRQDRKRAAIFAFVALALAVLAAVSFWFERSANYQRFVASANLMSARSRLEFEHGRNRMPIAAMLAREALYRLEESDQPHTEAFEVLQRTTKLMPGRPTARPELPSEADQMILQTRTETLQLMLADGELCSVSLANHTVHCLSTGRQLMQIADIRGTTFFGVSDQDGRLCFLYAADGQAPQPVHCEEPSMFQFRSDPSRETSDWLVTGNGRILMAFDGDRICNWTLQNGAYPMDRRCQVMAGISQLLPYGDDRVLVVANNRACVYTADERETITETASHTCAAVLERVVGVLPDLYLASANNDRVQIHDLTRNATFDVAVDHVWQVILNRDFHVAAIRQMPQASTRNQVFLVDLSTQLERTRLGHDGRINQIMIVPGTPYLLTRSGSSFPSDHTVSAWDLRSGEEVRRFVVEGPATTFAIAKDKSELAVSVARGEGAQSPASLVFWPLDWELLQPVPLAQKIVRSHIYVDRAPDVALIGEFLRTCVTEIGGSLQQRCVNHADTPSDIAFVFPDKLTAVMGGGEQAHLCVGHLGASLSGNLECKRGSPSGVEAISRNGQWFVIRQEGRLCVSAVSGAPPNSTRCLDAANVLKARLISDDGQLLLTDQDSNGTIVYDVGSSKPILTVPPVKGDWDLSEFSDDSRLLAISIGNGAATSAQLFVYDLTSGTERGQLSLPERVLSLTFGIQSILVLGVEQSKAAYLWNWGTGVIEGRIPLDFPAQAIAVDKSGTLFTLAGPRTRAYGELRRWFTTDEAILAASCRQLPDSIPKEHLASLGTDNVPIFNCKAR
ncbi:TIR domain-containing protein (plasmid) [Rhizobium beringeri]|uniref:TIR domain-containing protein n=1 Tax=Rhizobium beringeri TaxID=3019934 RepID=UPI002E12EDED|nr:TIR domain-containing protein [Rhizobium beringeri]